MMLLSGRNTAKVSAQTVSEDGERYRIEQNEEDGKRYLTDRHGQTVAGWHVRIGNKYYRIGKVNDIGLCRSKRFKIIFTKRMVNSCKMVWREDFPLMPGAYWQ